MAKAGEGDPRWIVEERSDAVNVNNWHWLERDVTKWSINTFESLLKEVIHEQDSNIWKVLSLSSDGIATISVRKGQLKKIIDFELTLKYEAYSKSDPSNKIEGEISIPEFTFDTNEKSLEHSISCTSTYRNDNLLKFVKSTCLEVLSTRFSSYKTKLEQECTKGLILPGKDGVNSVATSSESSVAIKNQFEMLSNEKVGYSIDATNLVLDIVELISSTPADVYGMFTCSEKMMMLTNSAAYIENKVGGKFSFLGGTIEGVFENMEKDHSLKMKWRLKSWPVCHLSNAVLTFTKEPNGDCKLVLRHDNIIAHDFERVETGWRNMFFRPLKRIFG